MYIVIPKAHCLISMFVRNVELVSRASEHAIDGKYLSPFARAANNAAQDKIPWWQKMNDQPPVYMGGKLDDITVVVGFVE